MKQSELISKFLVLLFLSLVPKLKLIEISPTAAMIPADSQFPVFCDVKMRGSDCDEGGNPRGPAGGLDTSIPFIISPRNTVIINDKPIIRWNPVRGASSYTATISDDQGETWWEKKQMRTTEIPYDGKPFQPGMSYSVVVQTDKGESSRESLPNLGFRRLSPDDVRQVETVTNFIAKQGLTDEAKALPFAYLYMGYGLRSEAIKVLEAEVTKGSKNLPIYRLLGDLYSRIQLNLLAGDSYEKAIGLANAANDIQALATVQAKLGEVYEARGDRTNAVRLYRDALNNYRQLGDSQRVREIEQKIKELTPLRR